MKLQFMKRVKKSWVALNLLVVAAGCATNEQDLATSTAQAVTLGTVDDAGDAAFFRQVIPVLYGRKVKGYQELKVLTDLSGQVGREVVVRQLMQHPEYVAKWSDVLVDALRIQREGFRDQSTCYGQPLQSLDHGEIAQFVSATQSTWSGQSFPGAVPGDYNMADVIQSSVAVDDLSAMFRASLLTLVVKKTTSMSHAAERQELGTVFEQTYLNRRTDCIGCHNSVSSATGALSRWDRTFPVLGNFDDAVFGAPSGPPDPSGRAVNSPERLHALFRADVACDPDYSARVPFNLTGNICPTYNVSAPVTDPPTAPPPAALPAGWVKPLGLSGCGYLKTKETIWTEGTPRGDAFPSFPYLAGNVPPQFASVWDVEDKFRRGVEMIRNGTARSEPMSVFDYVTGTVEYIYDEEGNPRYATTPESALATLIAEHAVDNVWKEIMGSPLTLPHGFSRNEAQREILNELTRGAFLPDWSLKRVIMQIVLSDAFNRKTPRARESEGGALYDLPMVFNTWVAQDPRETVVTDASANSVGDTVHRYDARDLFYSTGASLGIAGPRRVPSATAYPTREDVAALGQFLSDSSSGSSATTYQGLLAWERLHGVCVNRNATKNSDWVGRFMARLATFPASGKGSLSMNDVVVSMRDWLLADGTIASANESEALAAFFEVPSLATSAPSTVVGLESKLRGYCGVLVKSPQYMLAGLPTGPDVSFGLGAVPVVRVCNDSACSYQEICQTLQASMWQEGLILSCDVANLSVTAGSPAAKEDASKLVTVTPGK